jgi:hypothetical protein
LREESRLGVSENIVLRGIFVAKRDGVMKSRENFIKRSFMICTPHPVFCR